MMCCCTVTGSRVAFCNGAEYSFYSHDHLVSPNSNRSLVQFMD